MMRFSDETLMAFADGELDEALRRAIEAAMRSDPALAARIASYGVPRKNVSAACAPSGDAPAPPRMGATLHELSGHPRRAGKQKASRAASRAESDGREGALMRAVASVISLDSVRAARSRDENLLHPGARHWTWREWGAVAAALILGLVAGILGMVFLGH
jgi:anti-sigma factor RsiW